MPVRHAVLGGIVLSLALSACSGADGAGSGAAQPVPPTDGTPAAAAAGAPAATAPAPAGPPKKLTKADLQAAMVDVQQLPKGWALGAVVYPELPEDTEPEASTPKCPQAVLRPEKKLPAVEYYATPGVRMLVGQWRSVDVRLVEMGTEKAAAARLAELKQVGVGCGRSGGEKAWTKYSPWQVSAAGDEAVGYQQLTHHFHRKRPYETTTRVTASRVGSVVVTVADTFTDAKLNVTDQAKAILPLQLAAVQAARTGSAPTASPTALAQSGTILTQADLDAAAPTVKDLPAGWAAVPQRSKSPTASPTTVAGLPEGCAINELDAIEPKVRTEHSFRLGEKSSDKLQGVTLTVEQYPSEQVAREAMQLTRRRDRSCGQLHIKGHPATEYESLSVAPRGDEVAGGRTTNTLTDNRVMVRDTTAVRVGSVVIWSTAADFGGDKPTKVADALLDAQIARVTKAQQG